jgi:hypothetical protein
MTNKPPNHGKGDYQNLLNELAMMLLAHHDSSKMVTYLLRYTISGAQTVPSITQLKCTSASIQALSASTTKNIQIEGTKNMIWLTKAYCTPQ